MLESIRPEAGVACGSTAAPRSVFHEIGLYPGRLVREHVHFPRSKRQRTCSLQSMDRFVKECKFAMTHSGWVGADAPDIETIPLKRAGPFSHCGFGIDYGEGLKSLAAGSGSLSARPGFRRAEIGKAADLRVCECCCEPAQPASPLIAGKHGNPGEIVWMAACELDVFPGDVEGESGHVGQIQQQIELLVRLEPCKDRVFKLTIVGKCEFGKDADFEQASFVLDNDHTLRSGI